MVELVLWHGIRASVTKRSRVRISSTPPFSMEYFAPGMREAYAASTLQAQRALAWRGVIEYRSIPEASTINLSFWLSWSFDSFSHVYTFCSHCTSFTVVVLVWFICVLAGLESDSNWRLICWQGAKMQWRLVLHIQSLELTLVLHQNYITSLDPIVEGCIKQYCEIGYIKGLFLLNGHGFAILELSFFQFDLYFLISNLYCGCCINSS